MFFLQLAIGDSKYDAYPIIVGANVIKKRKEATIDATSGLNIKIDPSVAVCRLTAGSLISRAF